MMWEVVMGFLKHGPMPDILPAWTPFVEFEPQIPPALLAASEADYEVYKAIMRRTTHYANSRYIVTLERRSVRAGTLLILSIKGLWRFARHDWRDFQRIKNELVGKEQEMVELYPAESRLHDTANQFSLFGFEGKPMGIGWPDRDVSDAQDPSVVQRPFEPDARPKDAGAHDPDRSLLTPRPSRNALCPCGSGKKYKRCCGAKAVR
jgi:hypothetical protein